MHHRSEFHDELRRAKNSADSSLQLAMAVPQLLGSAVAAIGLIAAAAVTVPAMIPVVALSGIPLLLVSRANSEEMYSFSFGRTPGDRERFQLEGVLSSRDQAAEVRIFGIESYLVTRWRRLYDERITELVGLVRRFGRRSVIAAAGVAGTFLLVLGLGWWMVSSGTATLADTAVAGATALLLGAQVQQIATSLGQLSEHGLRLADFERLLAAGIERRAIRRDPAPPLRRLVVDRLGFAYPGASGRAVDDVSFTVGAGELVAIVGVNGSGKTTLAKLLCGLYRPDAGTVTWNDRPVHDLDLRGEVGAIFQTFARYWFSAADNIAIGDVARGDTADPAAVRRAAELAGADEFLGELAQGYDTRLTVELEGGTDLSLGQWQRVAIARVLYRDPSLVVLDEPTASLDPQAEAALFATLDDLRRDRTIVMISHRFSSVRSADRILVVDRGRLIEQGTHEQLLDLGGHYARLYRTQAAAFA
ncbi:ABC transporter ATP-binding protein [Microlunatus sp. GCM10028923]|uniref:ABC transporter ATP-binding protein n=1 Tax=Microlunatus sp. GCM10028923 TaxID=3273400 RepID=UPI00361F86FB